MPVMSEMGEMGFPDFICCIDGLFVAIEAKRGESIEPTTRQKFRMEDIKVAGGLALLVHKDNVEKFEALCREATSGSSFPRTASPGASPARSVDSDRRVPESPDRGRPAVRRERPGRRRPASQ